MSEYSIPNSVNFCGGNFQAWLEVNLISSCNGKCSWCVENSGWHPSEIASWEKMAEAALSTNKTNIILLGGEPTLYKDINPLIEELIKNNRKVWITTNGSLLTPDYINNNLKGIAGINISIHHFDLKKNMGIVHIDLNEDNLRESIKELHKNNAEVRFNCNTIKNYVDSETNILEYIRWAKNLGVDSIRFAELKLNEEDFVDLAKELNYNYGLNDDPYKLGCNCNTEIEGVKINFRQMCGLQTTKRTKPINPKQYGKEVLYYDGKVYNGWQLKDRKLINISLEDLLKKVADKELGINAALNIINNSI